MKERPILFSADMVRAIIDVWCAAHGKQITWSKAIEIMAVITKMPDEEKQHLLFLDEVAQ